MKDAKNRKMSSDMIETLPTDQTEPTQGELVIIDNLFRKQMGILDRALSGLRDVVVIGVVFLLISTSQAESLIKRFIPVTENSCYLLLLVKTLCFMFMYFLVKNLYLVRK